MTRYQARALLLIFALALTLALACERPLPLTPPTPFTDAGASDASPDSSPPVSWDAAPPLADGGRSPLLFCGTNLSGAEFGSKVPGTYGVDYQWPDPSDIEYFLAKGMNHLRFPFRMERLQPVSMGPLDETEWNQLKYRLAYATNRKMTVAFEPHNSFRRGKDCTVSAASDPRCAILTPVEVADFAGKLAARVKGYPRVQLTATNEPHHMATELVRDLDQAFVTGTRLAGFAGVILVPGNAFSGAGHWASNWYGTPNSQIMQQVAPGDPNVWFELHLYLDSDSSGKYVGPCISETIGVERLNVVTGWMRTNKRKALLAEIGAPNTPVCKKAVENVLAFLGANADVWVGVDWWSAGWASFSTTYPLSIGPSDPAKPQLLWLLPFLPCGGT